MRRGGDGGQATAELALVLPLVAALLLAVVQVALVARDQIMVVHAAREAARQAAVDPRPAAVTAAAARAGPLDPARLRVVVRPGGAGPATVVAEAEYRSPTGVALVGPLLPDVTLRAKAAMRDETSRGE